LKKKKKKCAWMDQIWSYLGEQFPAASGFCTGLVFHRVIPNFLIQGKGGPAATEQGKLGGDSRD
jgi:cyclophilin family peptidyl-prolyl cis-trans isomerase